MTIESVDKALDEVRPYLIADGGDVTVTAVEATTGTVFLRLEVCKPPARQLPNLPADSACAGPSS